MKIIGSIAKDNDFIVYGNSKDNNYLVISIKSRFSRAWYTTNNTYNLFSCKFIENI